MCLSDIAVDTALEASVVALAPSALCEPVFRTVELRNRSGARLGDGRIEVVISDRPGETPLTPIDARTEPPIFFQMSVDDGASWSTVEPPLRQGDRLIWTVDQAPLLARLGPNSSADDSVLLRWRAPLGEIHGGAFAPDASVGVTGSAVDACGAVAEAPFREGLLTALQPQLYGRLVGRNVTRGGPFSDAVPAAPGDVIEWRLEIENAGEATARSVTAAILTPDGPLPNAIRVDGGASEGFAQSGVLSLEPVAAGGLRTAVFRAEAPASCGRRPVSAEAAFGCVTPEPGRMAALRADTAASRAWIVATPDNTVISIRPSISDAAGGAAPGAEAQIRVVVRNEGPPAFRPALEIAPPDGFEIPLDAQIELRATSAAGPTRVAGVTIEPGEGDRRILRFTAAEEGVEPVFSAGERIEVSFVAYRARRTLGDSDIVEAALLFRDGCGQDGRTIAARARTPLRQAELRLDVEPVDGAVLRIEDGVKSFIATVANVGDARADTVTLAIAPGAAWSAEAPEGCAAAPLAEGAPRFLCVLDGPLAPGAQTQRRFELRLARSTPDPQTMAGGGLNVALSAEARAADASGAPTGAALARASYDASVVGFSIRQRLTTAGGEPLDPADAIDLGRQVAIELEAQWFGVGGGRVEDAALAIYLPPHLGVVSAEQIDGDVALIGARLPRRGGSGRALWSLGAVGEGARAVFRIEATAIDPPAEARIDFAASISRAVVEADAIFTVDGQHFGVDAAEAGPTRATPLELIFRRPDLRLRLNFVGANEAPTPFGAPQPRAGEGRWVAAPGDVIVVEAALGNLGAGPGYFDWVRLEAPPGVEILPFGRDGVDNDNDGRVDEPDEAAVAYVGPARERLGGETATEARWSGEGGGALGGAERLIRPNGERVWRAALRLSPEAAPDRTFRLRAEAQFGAQPAPQSGEGARSRVRLQPSLGAAPIEGWFVLTETSVGADLNEVVLTGEHVQHRLTMGVPPGRLRDARIVIDFDPAYQRPDRLDARFGPDVRCAEGASGALVERPDGAGWRAVWRLGDCVTEAGGLAANRRVIIDVGAMVRDADPELSAEERAAWRLPRVVGMISYADAEAEGGRAEVKLGETALSVSGPAPRLAVEAPTRSDAAEPDAALDAGDRYQGVLRLVNAGDQPTAAAIVRYGWPEDAAGRGAPAAMNCAALGLETAEQSAEIERVSACLLEARFDFANDPLAPGEVVEIRLLGALTAQAPIAGALEAPISAVFAPAGADGLSGWTLAPSAPRGAVLWSVPVRAPERPAIAAARAGAPVAIGDPVLLRGRYALPEGAGPVSLAIRLRFEGRGGRAAPAEAPLLDVTAATLTRSRDDMRAAADLSGLNTAPAQTPVALRPADDETGEGGYLVFVDAQGWTVIAAPLGETGFDAPSEDLGEGVYAFELTTALRDTPTASRGRRLMAEAIIVRGGAEALASAQIGRSETLLAAELAEPFLDLAALHEDADGSAQLGERVAFVGRVCNRGRAPAYGAVLRAEIPTGFALDPQRPPLYVFDDGPEALGPRPYGAVSIEADGVLMATTEDATPIEPGACVALRVPSFAERPATASRDADGVFAAPDATARFEVVSYRGRPSAAAPGRLYSGVGPSSASVRRRDLVIDAPATAFLDPDGWIRQPFTVRRAGRLRDAARLSLIVSNADELTWTIFQDVNRDGQVDGGDRLWRDGAALPSEGGLAFVARARPESAPPLGWRRTALLRAAAVTEEGRLLTGAREIVAARGSQRDGVMRAERVMAVDRDCDGRLEDEAAQDSAFEKSKEAAVGDCVVMRVTFRNDGVASVERVEIEDVVPDGARYLAGSATFASTPAGLVGRRIEAPDAGEAIAQGGRLRVRFVFVGSLAPGLEGVVEYRVRIAG